MKFKALILDVDGTLIPNRRDGMPSDIVAKAIAKANKRMHVSIASSRPPFLLAHIIDHLRLSGPSITNGGAQVLDFAKKKTYYRQVMNIADIQKVMEITKKYKVKLLLDDDVKEILAKGGIPEEEILGVYAPAVDFDVLNNLLEEIKKIPTVSSHVTPSWTKGKWSISVSDAKATKQHGVIKVAEILGIDPSEIIAVGDGYNDFPLLMASGLKVAMGNAVDDVKAIADYIAPSVEEDGVADVINKFVLN